MRSFKQIDFEIKDSLSKAVDNINPSEDMFTTINNKINDKITGGYYMKVNKSKKIKTVLIACFILLLTSATCFAAVEFILYTNLPENKEVSNEIGFSPKYIKEFKNGYVFLEGGVNKDWSISDGSNDLEMRYERDNTIVNYHAIKTIKGETSLEDFTSRIAKDEILENITISDNIPAAYIYNDEYIWIVWEQDNVSYILSQYNKILDIPQMSKDEILEMAKDIINS